MRFHDHLAELAAARERAGLLRQPAVIGCAQGPRVVRDGRAVLSFCSNDYLGLAAHPAIATALADGAARWGSGAGASRLIVGTLPPHRAAERALASLLARPDALLFSSGYAANTGAVSGLLGPGDLVLSDELNHASLIDGCRLSRARVLVYRHRDVAHAAELLAAHRGAHRAALLVTETVFSMDGDLAPLADLADLAARHDAGLFVDEAHALGVLGPYGRGLAQALGITPDVAVGTLGKSLGLAGAFVAGDPTLRVVLENLARSYVYSTGVSPAVAHAAVTAAQLVSAADDRRARLAEHTARLRDGLRELGYRVPEDGQGPVVPVLVGDSARTMALSRALLELGVFVAGIRPPTVPPGTARLRVVASAAHERADVDEALAAFAAARGAL